MDASLDRGGLRSFKRSLVNHFFERYVGDRVAFWLSTRLDKLAGDLLDQRMTLSGRFNQVVNLIIHLFEAIN